MITPRVEASILPKTREEAIEEGIIIGEERGKKGELKATLKTARQILSLGVSLEAVA